MFGNAAAKTRVKMLNVWNGNAQNVCQMVIGWHKQKHGCQMVMFGNDTRESVANGECLNSAKVPVDVRMTREKKHGRPWHERERLPIGECWEWQARHACPVVDVWDAKHVSSGGCWGHKMCEIVCLWGHNTRRCDGQRNVCGECCL